MLSTIISVFYIILLARVIISWVPQLHKNPVSELIYRVTEPILKPIRNVIPPVGGLDLSVLVLFFALQFLQRWLVGIGL